MTTTQPTPPDGGKTGLPKLQCVRLIKGFSGPRISEITAELTFWDHRSQAELLAHVTRSLQTAPRLSALANKLATLSTMSLSEDGLREVLADLADEAMGILMKR